MSKTRKTQYMALTHIRIFELDKIVAQVSCCPDVHPWNDGCAEDAVQSCTNLPGPVRKEKRFGDEW